MHVSLYDHFDLTFITNESIMLKMGLPLFRGETLDLYGNQIEHILSWSWLNMTSLKFLRLGNKITTISYNTTEDLINLKEFTLSARESDEAALLDGVTQIMLKKMFKLTSLTLGRLEYINSVNYFRMT